MLQLGRFRFLFDTVDEGVLVTVHDPEGFVCQVVEEDANRAVRAAIAAAILGEEAEEDAA
jgi:hypothetical protein